MTFILFTVTYIRKFFRRFLIYFFKEFSVLIAYRIVVETIFVLFHALVLLKRKRTMIGLSKRQQIVRLVFIEVWRVGRLVGVDVENCKLLRSGLVVNRVDSNSSQ